MKFEATIGEIPTRLFAKPPTPAELGDFVSRWPCAQIAEFLSALGEGVRNRSKRPIEIGYALDLHEKEWCCGWGSELINDVNTGLLRALAMGGGNES